MLVLLPTCDIQQYKDSNSFRKKLGFILIYYLSFPNLILFDTQEDKRQSEKKPV